MAASLWLPERDEEFFKKQKAALSRVIELVPDTDLALRVAASLSGDLVEEERLTKKALLLDPEDIDLDGGYGGFLLSAGRPTEAFDTWQRLMRKDPLNALFYLMHGATYEFTGNIDAAVMEFKKGKELTNQTEFYDGSLLRLAMTEENRVLINEYVSSYVNPRDLNHVMHALLDTPDGAGAELRFLLADPANKNFLNRCSIAVWASYFGEDELALQAYSELKVSE